jgi:CTP-dependent riboflavin kinase
MLRMLNLNIEKALRLSLDYYPTRKEASIIKFINLFGTAELSTIFSAFYTGKASSNGYRLINNLCESSFIKKIKKNKSNLVTLDKRGIEYIKINQIEANDCKEISANSFIASYISSILIGEGIVPIDFISYNKAVTSDFFAKKISPTLHLTLPNKRYVFIDICTQLTQAHIEKSLTATRSMSLHHHFVISINSNDLFDQVNSKGISEKASFHLESDVNLKRALMVKTGFAMELPPLNSRISNARH